jgi:hypothetical protein
MARNAAFRMSSSAACLGRGLIARDYKPRLSFALICE